MAPIAHFTDKSGWNGIRAAKVWRFLAHDPPADHPRGAYFTNLDENTPYLATKLRIPRSKLAYVFQFAGAEGLKKLPGGRGRFVLYSEGDYLVAEFRQMRSGGTSL